MVEDGWYKNLDKRVKVSGFCRDTENLGSVCEFGTLHSQVKTKGLWFP